MPTLLIDGDDGDKIRAMRNLRRYIQKAEKVVLDVARGASEGLLYVQRDQPVSSYWLWKDERTTDLRNTSLAITA